MQILVLHKLTPVSEPVKSSRKGYKNKELTLDWADLWRLPSIQALGKVVERMEIAGSGVFDYGPARPYTWLYNEHPAAQIGLTDITT